VTPRFNRRSFLLGSAALGLNTLLSSCGTPPAQFKIRLLKGSVPVQMVGAYQKLRQTTVPLDLLPEAQPAQLFTLLQRWDAGQDGTPPTGLAKLWPLRQPDTVADLVSLGDAWLPAAVRQGVIQPFPEPGEGEPWLSWAWMPEFWRNVGRRDGEGFPSATGQLWAVPYRWGSTVIAYRQDQTQQWGWEPQDWDDLWREEVRDRLLLPDHAREVMGLVAKSLGYSYNQPNPDKIPGFTAKLAQLQQQVKFYSSNTYLQPLLLIIVAIDAGHGGEDPGALAYDRKIREKDVALAISRALFERLQTVPGFEPVMVREGDYSVQLQRRPQIARQQRADIFLSIHADSYSTSRAEGVTIYALSEKIAVDENSRRVAEKENSADLLGGVAGDTSLRNIEDDLARTLLDLSMAWSIEQSITAGDHILSSLKGVATLRRDKTQQGNLWVLRSPDIPSLLIETGYLSNPDEARKLNSANYQRRLADGIVQGVVRYFASNPPEDTLLAYQKANNIQPDFGRSVASGGSGSLGGTHVVARGDSLSVIAQRNGISTRELREYNNLRNDVIHVGQELRIPGGFSLPEVVEVQHKAERGDTLSGIAARYRVSLSSLRAANDLRNDVIHVGQVLTIPAP